MPCVTLLFCSYDVCCKMADNISCIGIKCCGCEACGQICPTGAISFKCDTEGFDFPEIDEDKCISCGRCLKVCPINIPFFFEEKQIGYAAKIASPKEQSLSASGGIFFAVAKNVISSGGIVCGCVLDDDLMPRHVMSADLAIIEKMRGSKYVESSVRGFFACVRKQLEEQRYVFFSGTPCQVAGLRRFLGKRYDNLICADIICHGVPSRKLFKLYIDWLSDKYHGKIIDYSFRDKRIHRWSLTRCVSVSFGRRIKYYSLMASLDPYYYNYLQGNTYRESCYECPYARSQRAGDISLGDFWGVEKSYPKMFDINGVSSVLVNSNSGALLVNMLIDKGLIVGEEVEPDSIVSNNGNLREATARPEIRNVIYKTINGGGFGKIPYDIGRKSYAEDSIKNRIPNKIRQRFKRLFCTTHLFR